MVFLLIDICKSDTQDNKLTMKLVDLAHLIPCKNLQVIISFASATGKFINNEYVYSSIHNVLHESKVQKVEFQEIKIPF